MKKNLTWLILGLFVLILAIVAIYLLKSEKINFQAAGEPASFYLSPGTGTYKVGENFDIDLMLETGGLDVQSVEVKYLKYDPEILEVIDSDSSTDGIQVLAKSSVLRNVTVNNADASNGQIALFLAGENDETFNGAEAIASIKFKAKKQADKTLLNFDFSIDNNSDSNVWVEGVDVLTKVTGSAFVIESPAPAIPTVDLKVNNSDGPIEINTGASATLTWIATPEGAVCRASGGWTGDNKSITGTESTGSLIEAKTYTLACSNSAGSASDSVTVNIKNLKPLPDVTLKVNGNKQVTIKKGAGVTLTWEATVGSNCLASGNWTGTKTVSGSEAVTGVSEAKTFILICSNETGSVHDRALVYIENQIPPVLPSVDLKANNSDSTVKINKGSSVTLSWVSSNADSCEASNGWQGVKNTSGSEKIDNLALSKTFTLMCKKGSSNVIDSVTVNIVNLPPAEPGPSDGNQALNTVPAENEEQIAANLPVPVQPETITIDKEQESLYKGSIVKPWILWTFYIIIPISLTLGIVYFYISRKKSKSSAKLDFNKPISPDWPKQKK